MNNKDSIELVLQEIEDLCPGLLTLFFITYQIADDFLESVMDLLPEESIKLSYPKMNIKTSISLVRSFLKEIDKKYLEIFDKSLNDGTFELFYEEDNFKERPNYPITTPKPNSSIYIPVKNTVEDGAVILHEFFHFLNDADDLLVVRDIFSEMISIYYELRYYMFLFNKGYNIDNLYKEIYERVDNSFDSANSLCYSSFSLDVYYNTGNINKESIKFIDKFRKTYKKNSDDMLNFYKDESFEEVICDIRVDMGYVFGTLLALFALNNYELYDIKMKYINDNINNFSIEKVLDTLETKFVDYPLWIQECVKKLEIALGEIYEKDNSNSRTNRSR